jgi:hypothetical protein
MTKPLCPCASDEAPVAILQAPPPLAEQEAPIRENYDVDSLLTEHHFKNALLVFFGYP